MKEAIRKRSVKLVTLIVQKGSGKVLYNYNFNDYNVNIYY